MRALPPTLERSFACAARGGCGNRVEAKEILERKDVEPFYLEKAQAVYYAQQRGRLGNATVRIYDEQGKVEREIEPPKEEQMLYYPSKP